MAMFTWEIISCAWMDALNDHAPDKLAHFLADDFKWVTHASDPDGLDRSKTLEFIEIAPVTNGVTKTPILKAKMF